MNPQLLQVHAVIPEIRHGGVQVRQLAGHQQQAVAEIKSEASFLEGFGYVGPEDNPYNQLFFLVVAIAFTGALMAGFRARGMAWAMSAGSGATASERDMLTQPDRVRAARASAR